MSGKIYPESTNLYQDQARILFDYYRDAAEKIVREEERLEKEIAILQEKKAHYNTDISKLNTFAYVMLGIGAALGIAALFLKSAMVLLLIGAGAALAYGILKLVAASNMKKDAAENGSRIAGFQQEHDSIFRDYKMNKLGVACIPVAGQIPFEGKSFLVDYTGSSNSQPFKLQTLRQSDLLISKIDELEELLKNAPVVEGAEEPEEVDTDQYSTSIQKVVYNDYFGKLDRNIRTLSYCLTDLEITSVSLPVIMPESSHSAYLNEFSTSETGNLPVIKPFETSAFDKELEQFRALNEIKKSLERHSNKFEDVLKNFMANMGSAIQAIAKLKTASTFALIDTSNRLLFKIFNVSYNHYSPILEAEEIERIRTETFNFSDSVENYQPFNLKKSSRLKYDLISDSWVAEDNSRTNFPFSMHQIHEEIVAPIVQNLMMETRIERLKIYNNIKDQKISYLNKWHQDTEDFYGRNRAESSDLINLMRSTLSEYVANVNTLSSLQQTEKSMEKSLSLKTSVVKTEDNSAEVYAAFDIKSKEFQRTQDDFESYMLRLKDDIEERAKKFDHIEYYEASLRDSNPKEMVTAGDKMNELEERRKPLVAINPAFAEKSQLQPAPQVENLAYEHMSLNLSTISKTALSDLNTLSKRLEDSKNVPPVAANPVEFKIPVLDSTADESKPIPPAANTGSSENDDYNFDADEGPDGFKA